MADYPGAKLSITASGGVRTASAATGINRSGVLLRVTITQETIVTQKIRPMRVKLPEIDRRYNLKRMFGNI